MQESDAVTVRKKAEAERLISVLAQELVQKEKERRTSAPNTVLRRMARTLRGYLKRLDERLLRAFYL